MKAARRERLKTGIQVLLSGFALAVMTATAAPSFAAEPCYTQTEMEAEHAIRLHSEMMVVGLKCHKHYAAEKPFHAYADFTKRNSAAIARFEQVLIGHMRKRGERNPTRAFDRMRTIIANDYARQSNMVPTRDYCEAKLGWLAEVGSMGQSAFRNHVVNVRANGLTMTPLCSARETFTAQRPMETAFVPPSRLPRAKPTR